MLVPEHQEEEECIYITYVEVIFAVASCKEDTGEAEDRRQQVNQQDGGVASYCE